ncbi:hypothetical protein [Photobacterium toruni]|uniref:Uncharacterized protein n=1 Tax=Photobacterium toruni TaxID=1935446 RepID=A0A1T4T666_9GAMM|nr:hypothetical protein [Photobacterium toruni]SKA35903.1 hypothetical protein CZ814_01992 [Photobacterium toruni]
MAKIVGYKFEDNDPDINFLKARFGGDLSIFNSEYEREHRPGSIYGFSSFELLPVLCEHPEWLEGYWCDLLEKSQGLLSRWSTEEQHKIYTFLHNKEHTIATVDAEVLESYSQFESLMKSFSQRVSGDCTLTTREVSQIIRELESVFFAFIDEGENKRIYTTGCNVTSGYEVYGYHIAATKAAVLIRWLFRYFSTPREGFNTGYFILTPFCYALVAGAMNRKNKHQLERESKSKDVQDINVRKHLPDSVDQFVLQKIAGGSNTIKLANLFRDTYIKAWVYHKLMTCEDGRFLTQKSLVIDLQYEYQKLIDLLPPNVYKQLLTNKDKGDSDATYNRILKEIRSPACIINKYKTLGLESPMDTMIRRQFGAPSDLEKAIMQERMRNFLG